MEDRACTQHVDMCDIVRGQMLFCVIPEMATRGRHCQEYQRADHLCVSIDQQAGVALTATQKENPFKQRGTTQEACVIYTPGREQDHGYM